MPIRVVSLLPSATESLCCIEGGESLLVGRSHECDCPPGIADRPVLTAQRTTATSSAGIDQQVRDALADGDSASLYILDAERLQSLRPDVILTQDLCDVCSIDLQTVRRIAAGLSPAPTILSLNPRTIEDVFDDVLRIGQAVHLVPQAQAAMVRLRERFWSARDFVNPYIAGEEVAFLEWIDPLFAGGHWTPQLIEAAGGRHSLNPPGAMSRRMTPDELIAANPDRLIVCPCGFGLDVIQREMKTLTTSSWWHQMPAVKSNQVMLVDGSQMFNRPGPRLVEAYCWLVAWLHDRSELWPSGFPCQLLAQDQASFHQQASQR